MFASLSARARWFVIKEIWKPINIPNIKPFYEVSNYGRVRSIGHSDDNGAWHNTKIKRSSRNPRGYARVTLRKVSGKQDRTILHRLVAKAFVPNPHNYNFVIHKNGNRMDSRASNLFWARNSRPGNKHPRHVTISNWKLGDNCTPIYIFNTLQKHPRPYRFPSIVRTAKALHRTVFPKHTVRQIYTELDISLNSKYHLIYNQYKAVRHLKGNDSYENFFKQEPEQVLQRTDRHTH